MCDKLCKFFIPLPKYFKFFSFYPNRLSLRPNFKYFKFVNFYIIRIKYYIFSKFYPKAFEYKINSKCSKLHRYVNLSPK